jgi:hypothetical protein
MATPSPFPGMDPYLESHWEDVHQSVTTYARDQLQGQLPGDLHARLQERVYLATEGGRRRDLHPDVRVTERSSRRDNGAVLTITPANPVVVEIDDPITESFIEIREPGGGRLVTVIEFLSPKNKRRGPGRKLYKQKQDEVLEAGVSLVEIDLLRGGKYTLALPEELMPEECAGPYRVCAHRGWVPSRFEVYPISLREPLPAIAIPLRKSDSDVVLDLQSLIALSYRNGRYDEIDYRKEPKPKLDREDAAWADELLKGKGMR